MRIFLAAVLAAVILAVGAIFVVNVAQRSSAAAYTTDGARINPRWSLRRLVHRTPQVVAGQTIRVSQLTGNAEDDECEIAGALAWLMVDFGDEASDNPACK